MARFLPVAPAQLLTHLFQDIRIRNDAFLLAHDVAVRRAEYSALQSKWGQSPFSLTIMDNSVIELGGAVDFDMIAEACDIAKPHVVVLPDVLLDGNATIDATCSVYDKWHKHFWNHHRHSDDSGCELMFVPQGDSLANWLHCLETVMEEFSNRAPKWIGIPRNTTERIVAYRRDLVELVHARYPAVKIHLLGFSDMIWNDVVSARHPGVTSIDSAVPLRLASVNQKIAFHSEIGKRGDWWDTCEYNELMADNVSNYNQWIHISSSSLVRNSR